MGNIILCGKWVFVLDGAAGLQHIRQDQRHYTSTFSALHHRHLQRSYYTSVVELKQLIKEFFRYSIQFCSTESKNLKLAFKLTFD